MGTLEVEVSAGDHLILNLELTDYGADAVVVMHALVQVADAEPAGAGCSDGFVKVFTPMGPDELEGLISTLQFVASEWKKRREAL